MKLNEPYLKELNECLKYSPLKVENIYMKGVIEVKKFRKYSCLNNNVERIEVDINFKGMLHAYHDKFGHEWYGPEILKEPQTSKIRVNKNIRNQSYKSVVNLLTMFFGDGQYYEIKKVSWD